MPLIFKSVIKNITSESISNTITATGFFTTEKITFNNENIPNNIIPEKGRYLSNDPEEA